MRVLVLTGAGISAESGLPTFRGEDGLWEGHRVESVATPEAFASDPKLVYKFYNMRRLALKDVRPNAAHRALYKLEQALGEDFLLVTQNVDNLHDRCGHRRIRHMHGRLDEARNEAGDVIPWSRDLGPKDRCPTTGSRLRPNIVWFGEVPFHLDGVADFLQRCTVFCAIGTSGLVYPAANFAQVAWQQRTHTVEINLERTGGTFADTRRGRATKLVPQWVAELIERARWE
ncbi:MAG: NAD-dependent protein deacylase [Planctomycetes bacterium]|jgi:NAD-dependent deacetylase|nr:NAD-dependent protein deacylase [Planctomycetota bacterium]MDP6424020.1 NAD-dependent deacylase [Planctomycetota bacterium]